MDNGASSYRRFLEGDNEGFVEIIRDYKDGLMLYLNGYVHDIHDAEDLMEDTFVKIYAKRPKFSEKYSFKTWLYTIGRNVAIDHLRKEKRGRTRSIEDMSDAVADKAQLEIEYLKKEDNALLLSAMDSLKDDYRQTLYLKYFEGLSNDEISKVMGRSRRQVENLLYRGKQALKSIIGQEGSLR